MTDRPNRRALIDALDIYRDAMRPFIVRHLKRIPGRQVEDCIKSAFRDERYNQFEKDMREGRSVEDAIDVNDFPWIVKAHWYDVFHIFFKQGDGVRDSLLAISNARNRVAHPERQDIDLEYAERRLDNIASVLLDINEPGQSSAVENIRKALQPFKTPAHRFRQGDRDVYAFTLDLETLNNLLPERVDDRVVKDANRPLTATHARKIQRYLEDRDDWLLGTLLLGISPDAIEFQSYTSDSDTDNAVGELTIRSEGAASMKMFDGQHRRRAIRDVLAELSQSVRYSPKHVTLKEASLPVMLYAEDRIDALMQMFADAAKTRRTERNTVTRFDLRDAFNLAAQWISEYSDLFSGRVELERASVSRTSHNIISINQLAMALKTKEVGFRGRVSKDRNDENMLEIESLYERCLTWADDFMPSARDEYNDLMAGEIDNSEIPEARSKTMAYNATVIRILAGAFYEWTKDDDDWVPLADFLRGASLKPGVKSGSLLVDIGVVAPGSTSPVAQRETVIRAIEFIVKLARESRNSSNSSKHNGGLK